MFFSVLSALLLIIQTAGGSSGHYWTLIPNVIVVEKELENSVEVQLVCGAAYSESMEISWTREGVPLHNRGNDITITVQELKGGNYTCHDSTGAVLNHQLVLVQLIHKDPNHRRILERTGNKDYIKCLSRNYSGIFHCSWKWSPSRVGAVVHISAKRSKGEENITCSVDENGSGITCLDQFQCMKVEELDYISLSVYMRHVYRLEEYAVSQFSITEIVKPDKVDIDRVNENTFELNYPKTWNEPHSYYPLTFHIKVITPRKGRDCTYGSASHHGPEVQGSYTQNQTFSVGNRKQFRLCVQAQDRLCKTGWSEWSHYEVKRP